MDITLSQSHLLFSWTQASHVYLVCFVFDSSGDFFIMASFEIERKHLKSKKFQTLISFSEERDHLLQEEAMRLNMRHVT